MTSNALSSRPLALVLAALAAAPACSSAEYASQDPVVCDVEVVALASDDAEALGFSADEVMKRFGGAREAKLEYFDGGAAGLTIEAKLGGKVEKVTTSYPEGVAPGDEPGLECGSSWMRMAVELAFQTDDGVFDEVLVTSWEMTELELYASVIVDLPLAEVAGSYQAAEDGSLSFNITLAEAEESGVVVRVVPEQDGLGQEYNVARFNQETWPQTQ